jgi:hypothetical protein
MKRVASDLSGELQVTTKKSKRVPKLDEFAEFDESEFCAKNSTPSKIAKTQESENAKTAEIDNCEYDTVPFVTLPIDILLHILSFLSPRSSLPLASSSKNMKSVCEEKRLWTNVRIGNEKEGEWIIPHEAFCNLPKRVMGHIESVLLLPFLLLPLLFPLPFPISSSFKYAKKIHKSIQRKGTLDMTIGHIELILFPFSLSRSPSPFPSHFTHSHPSLFAFSSL